MILKIRQRMAQDESGFTLVELLVVMLILGILAAIAIPAFFNQKNKAGDAQAKSYARSAETAMETYFTDNGSYDSGTVGLTELAKIEPTLNGATNLQVAPGTAAGPPADNANNSYTVSVDSPNGDGETFSITRHADGTTEQTCAPVDANGCPSTGDWSQ